MKISIIYPFRNRDIKRINKSLKSLEYQTNDEFEVFFIDYGSEEKLANQVKKAVQAFSFAQYKYYPVQNQPWNKSRAINSVVKNLDDGFCFVADVDMIFHEDFINKAISLQESQTATYFKVGFLNETETKLDKPFKEYNIAFESTYEATGLTMFPVKALKEINGFDEFYHFWGAEDTDVHVRLENAGYKVNFYEQNILMLHQWHPSYRSRESKSLTNELRLTNVVRLNQEHLKFAITNKVTKVNEGGWGNPMSDEIYKGLINFNGAVANLNTQKEIIDHFIFCELPSIDKNGKKIIIKYDTVTSTLKYRIKKILRKTLPSFYTLKEVNDKLLVHIISFYRNYNYILKVTEETKEIVLIIRK